MSTADVPSPTTSPAAQGGAAFSGPRRFLSDQPRRTADFVQGAQTFVQKLRPEVVEYLYYKPFGLKTGLHSDIIPTNRMFFHEVYQVLNLIRAMNIRPGGRVLEVGSGPGWVTEILLGLSFEVDGIEPCQDMIDIANERVASFLSSHRFPAPPRYSFHHTTLEECSLPDESFDAVLFHEALHHVIDEDKGLSQCFRLLVPGGVFGVDEGAWIPGSKSLEDAWEKEMARFNTLENPFTPEYLDHLLAAHGFKAITRYDMINGFIPADFSTVPIGHLADAPAAVCNNLTALKPGAPTTREADVLTQAEITIRSATFEAATRRAELALTLVNTGQTTWLADADRRGFVTIALRQGQPGAAAYAEAHPRATLSADVAPRESVEVDLSFTLPPGMSLSGWEVDLINEKFFWFSQRGTVPALVVFREAD
jgi:SAM-dependent methyltransferase